jgi:uncharacterized protein with HEPN domain
MNRIIEYTEGLEFDSFRKDYKTVDAVIRNFEVIGEASKNLPEELKSAYPTMPWKEMYRLRNKITHEYFGIDYEIIWEIVKTDIPDARKIITTIIEGKKIT